jgi:hypothetical protein
MFKVVNTDTKVNIKNIVDELSGGLFFIDNIVPIAIDGTNHGNMLTLILKIDVDMVSARSNLEKVKDRVKDFGINLVGFSNNKIRRPT